MPRNAGQTRLRILTAAQRQFFQRGFARVGMNDVAKSAGLTKRTLYLHFGSKDALLEAMLEHQRALSERTFRASFSQPATDPEEAVIRLFDNLVTWAGSQAYLGSGFTRLACELGDLPGHPAMRLARMHKATVEDLFAARLGDAGVVQPGLRARKIWMVMEGAMIMMLLHRDPAYLAAAKEAALSVLRA